MANFILFITSSLPKKAESSYMSGPCPVPTRATRQAFQGLMPVSSVQGSMISFWPSTLQSLMPSSTFIICCNSSAVVSFQFLRMNLSFSLSNSVGATKKNFVSGHKSLGKEMLRFFLLPCQSVYSMTFSFIILTTSASCSVVASMPFSFNTLSKAGHQSVSGRWMRY